MASISERHDKMIAALLIIQAHTYKSFEALQTKALNLSKQCAVADEVVENIMWIVKSLEKNVPRPMQVHFTALKRQSAVLQNEAQNSMLGVMRQTQEMRGLSKCRTYVDCGRIIMADCFQFVAYKCWYLIQRLLRRRGASNH